MKLRMTFAHEKVFKEMRATRYAREVDTAFRLIYLQSFSFMGDGTTFGRRYKDRTGMSGFTIENFTYVKDWTIENEDFRDLMGLYNKPRVLFYLDPPYVSSGKKYKHNFDLKDLMGLKKSMGELIGPYLLNLFSHDHGMGEIFGAPNRVTE